MPYIILAILLCLSATARAQDNTIAQRFFNLTKEELKVDTLLPEFRTAFALPEAYRDSLYYAEIVYPEYQPLSAKEQAALDSIIAAGDAEELFAQPEGLQEPYVRVMRHQRAVVIDQKKGLYDISFAPIAIVDGGYRKLSSFMIRLRSEALPAAQRKGAAKAGTRGDKEVYAAHSVLASGKWAKISVAETGIHELTADVVKRAGFSDLSRVKIYGYGGNLQAEAISEMTLRELDDLKEVPSCTVNGRRFFFGKGTVHYAANKPMTRVRNPYSTHGYYLITDDGNTPASIDEQTLRNQALSDLTSQHVLHEVDNYSWYHGGRNLYEDSPIENGQTKTYTLDLSGFHEDATFAAYVAVTAGQAARYDLTLNGTQTLKGVEIKINSYDKGGSTTSSFNFSEKKAEVTIKGVSGGPFRLDYIDIYASRPKNLPDFSTGTFPKAQYVYNIANQDLHADSKIDMVIIVPTSQKFRAQADRLKDFHESRDGLKVKVVCADDLYNEFASGTPDANAYRRYLKMLYDRASSAAEQPKYLLLFGAGTFDGRMQSQYWTGKSADDYLLCFESENSFSETRCYTNDGFFTLLDEGEGVKQTTTDREDVAVGRLPAVSEQEAKTMVDKIIAYANNANAGTWQNLIVCLGDDGDENTHMRDAEAVANTIAEANPDMEVKKLMWDTYNMVASSTGNSYPDLEKVISQQEADGALIMDYSGHGSAYQLSHEAVIPINLFKTAKSAALPLWIAAACDVNPYDHNIENMAKESLVNPNGGAIAFLSSARSVYPIENRTLNQHFLTYLLNKSGDKPMAMGEALRRAKNEINSTSHPENKVTYALLGDPALSLNLPMQDVVVEKINGADVQSNPSTAVHINAMGTVTIEGHIEKDKARNEKFNGTIALTVKDAAKTIRCKQNNPSAAEKAFEYKDRTSIIYKGMANVKDGRFSVSFAVPKDIDYSTESSLIIAAATDQATHTAANGHCAQLIADGTEEAFNDLVGPSITCWLNTPETGNNAYVNETPFFYAEITDQDGINATGSAFGHDMELTIDGDKDKTYILNDNFTFDFGSYTKGTAYYSIPALTPGQHTLQFRAWDVKNNSSKVTLAFNVVKGLTPDIANITCTPNPAKENTTFIVSHNFRGTDMTVTVDVMSMAGQLLWQKTISETAATSGSNTVSWDLTTSSGGRLQTGVYLYRFTISSKGSNTTTKAKKIIII